MKISQIIQETTTSGSVAPTEHGFVKMQTRNPSVYGGNKVGNLLKGKKTSKPFANSLNEAAMKDLAYDLQTMKPAEFQKKYGKSREQMKASMSKQPQQRPSPPVNETDLSEQDLIVIPGQGRSKKSGFVKHDPDKAEHEGETLKNSLHTIVRVASHLDKELSVRANFPEWVSEKIGAVKSDMVSVMDYIISAKEMQTDPDTMESLGTTGAMTNGEMGESKDKVDSLVTDALKIIRGSDFQIEPARALKIVLGDREYNSRRGFYNFYVRQLMDMLSQEGLAEGLHPMVIDDVKKLATLNPTDRYSAYSNIRDYFKTDPALSKMASDLMGGYYEADMLRSKYKTAEAKAKYAELEPMNQAFIKQALGQEQGVAEGAKVDRMVKHVAKSEKKLGHSKKEAENIAWATANKRGMLDNKNKKK